MARKSKSLLPGNYLQLCIFIQYDIMRNLIMFITFISKLAFISIAIFFGANNTCYNIEIKFAHCFNKVNLRNFFFLLHLTLCCIRYYLDLKIIRV